MNNYIVSSLRMDKIIESEKKIYHIEILYEDDDFIFINKPFDMVINSNDENNQNTVHRVLLGQLSNRRDVTRTENLKHGFHFVNRLDYSTSGVMCLSKSKYGACTAGNLFETRKVTKIYTALLRGHLNHESIDVNTLVGYDSRYLYDNKMMSTDSKFMVQGKQSKTSIWLLETGYLNGEEISRVILKPHTGRRHQLRVHCKHIGHPIVGDYTYSDRQDTGPYRMFLHAYRLVLPLPNKLINVTASDDFVIDDWKCHKIYKSFDNIFSSL